jgi:glycosyltransferase involved in cell wall biosynthesis
MYIDRSEKMPASRSILAQDPAPAGVREPGQASCRFSSLSIVFPAYNEEDNIARAVTRARRVAQRYFDSFEIIVVNDGSVDGTREIVESLADHYPDVVAIHHPVNRGYGDALTSGLYRASKELVFFSDSDLQFDLDEIDRLVRHIDGFDIVAGYRANRADNAMRRLNAWAWNKLVQFTLGVRLRDVDCAFKMFRREVFDKVRVESAGAMVNTEIFTFVQQRKMTVKEVPVSHYPREAGVQSGANLRVIAKAFAELWRLKRKLNEDRRVQRHRVPASVVESART